jgi:plasmid stabilization system protein ParE
MSEVPPVFQHLLALPIPLLIACVLAFWSLFAVFVHVVLVPWIAGRNGKKLGHLEAEVPAQIGLAFGLLISFIAIPVWDQHTRAEDAARAESAAYREMLLILDMGDETSRAAIGPALQESIRYLAFEEWPQMADLRSPRLNAQPVRTLRTAIKSLPDSPLRGELHEQFHQASEARETRLRIASTRPPPARWTIVGVLAILTLLGVGLIHSESYRARRIALGMVAVGITCCFVILLAYTRPYVGQFRVQPVDLVVIVEEANANESIAVQSGGIRR